MPVRSINLLHYKFIIYSIYNGDGKTNNICTCTDNTVATYDITVQVITKDAFRTASIWLLTLASVIKCSVIVKPYTYWTLFTDRLLNTIISLISICSVVMTTLWLLGPTDPRASATLRYRHNTTVASRPALTS